MKEEKNLTTNIQSKTEEAIKLLKTFASAATSTIELCYSGGKDSDVILDLAKKAKIKFIPIYKNTTIDPPGTIKHVIDNNVQIVNPKKNFLDIIENKGFPTRRARFCCTVLKEYKIHDFAIQGIRRSESSKRASRYSADDPIICRIYGKKSEHVNIALPILNWTDQDIKTYIETNNIKCHPLYYDQQGTFHVERRLGCLGCPLSSDNGKAEFKEYPKLLRQVCKRGIIWWNNHPQTKSHKKFNNPYELLAHNLFFNKYEDWLTATITLYGRTDWKQELEKYFKINLDFKDINIIN